MDPVKQSFGDRAPVGKRVNVDCIPGASFEPSAVVRQCRESELPAGGSEKSLNVWSIHVSVRAPLLEDRGLVCNIERQTMRRVPHRDWLHEGPGGKLAVAHGTDASSVDARPHRIGNSHAEGESRLRLDVAKSNHRLPHTLWWRIDLDCGDRLETAFGGALTSMSAAPGTRNRP